MSNVQIVGRRSSVFTRLALLFAEELGIAYELVPIPDMTVTTPETYADNPALKLPILRWASSTIFGAQNICRVLAERAPGRKRIVWPEDLHDDVSRNAQELIWHCMSAQVQIVFGTVINKLPADNPYFTKARIGLESSLRWLDTNLAAALAALPPRDLSLFEGSLHCLFEHLVFRPTVPVDPYPALSEFCKAFAQRPSAQRTIYRFDKSA